MRYSRFQIGCVIVEYDLFNATTFIQNLTYAFFGIILTQFYVNFSRQEHKIDVLQVMLKTYPIPPFIFPLHSPELQKKI